MGKDRKPIPQVYPIQETGQGTPPIYLIPKD